MTRRRNPPLPSESRERARTLRTEQNLIEAHLWHRLRAGRLTGLKFRRQHPIPPHVVDFCCESAKLVVELDGSQHNSNVDAARKRAIESQGYLVLRFWDNDVMSKTELVLEAILSAVQVRTLSPYPSPGGRGERSEY